MEMNVNIRNARPIAAGRPDWEPPIERLRTEARKARESGKPDPWSVIEAECWIDLIDAELSALRAARDGASPAPETSLLRHWRAELQLIIRQLESVGARLRGGARA